MFFCVKKKLTCTFWLFLLLPFTAYAAQVYLSHLFVARDARIKTRNLDKDSALMWHHVRGDNVDGEDYKIEVLYSKSCHFSFKNWKIEADLNTSVRLHRIDKTEDLSHSCTLLFAHLLSCTYILSDWAPAGWHAWLVQQLGKTRRMQAQSQVL